MKNRLLLAILWCTFLLCGTALTTSAETGVTDTEIHVAQFGPITGPASPWGNVVRGSGMLFKMVNDEGGIHGRKIVYHSFDDSYNPARTMAGVKMLQENVGIFAWVGGVGTETGLAVKKYFEHNNIPWVGPFSGSSQWVHPPSRNIFSIYPQYYLEARTLCRYAVNTMNKKRIAILYQDDWYGKNGLSGASDELERNGMRLVAEIPVKKRDTDLKDYVAKLKEVEADTVLLWITPYSAVRVLKIAETQEISPQWMGSSSFADFKFMSEISNNLIDGLIVSSFKDRTNPRLMQKYKAAYVKFGGQGNSFGEMEELIDMKCYNFKNLAHDKNGLKPFIQAGIAFGEPMIEALKHCGRDLTRERFIEEMEKLDHFQGIAGEISFKPYNENDPTCRQGQSKVYLIQCVNRGKENRLTEWMAL